MKLLVVGGGGREHAIIKSLKKNPQAETIYALVIPPKTHKKASTKAAILWNFVAFIWKIPPRKALHTRIST